LLHLATSFVFSALPIGYSNKQGVEVVILSTRYTSSVVEATLL